MKNYGVLKGRAVRFTRDDDSSPHAELLMDASGVKFRIAINVRSSRGPQHQRLVEYLIANDFKHPSFELAKGFSLGWTDLWNSANKEAAFDYVRSNLFRPSEMTPITHMKPGPNNDLFEFVEALFNRAINDPQANVYAYGERWGPEDNKPDKYFDFKPGNGVHLIHMNQGDSGGGNKKYSDGALVVDFPSSNRSAALFIKFQNQAWHTDETNADPIPDAPNVQPIPVPEGEHAQPWNVIADDSPYKLARIVAAMVNPDGGDRGNEFVTVLNTSAQVLNLEGWKILDQHDRADKISGSVNPGEAITLKLTGSGALLSNKGGTITIVNDAQLKVDGVAYSKSSAKKQGKPVIF